MVDFIYHLQWRNKSSFELLKTLLRKIVQSIIICYHKSVKNKLNYNLQIYQMADLEKLITQNSEGEKCGGQIS